MKNSLLLFILLSLQAVAFAQPLKSYTWDTAALLSCRRKALANDATVTLAVNTIKANANKYVNLAPVNVTQKTAGWLTYFPAGTTFSSKEYVSFGEYYWPVAGHATDGTPWQYKEALGPDTAITSMYDNVRLTTMENIVTNCAQAYWVTNNLTYAKAAATQLRAWFVDTATAMLPDLNHAQFAPFVAGSQYGTHPGIIDFNGIYNVFNSAELLKSSGQWSASDDSTLKQWMYNFTQWLTNSSFGKAEGKVVGNNNHGIFYDALLITQWLYLGNNYNGVNYDSLAKDRILNFETTNRILYQIGNGQVVNGTPIYGGMWEELSRPNGSMYNAFAITAFVNLGMLAQKVGVDLFNWNYGGTDPRSIREAIQWGIPYLEGRKKWIYGDTATNPITNNQLIWNMWSSSTYIPAQADSFNNYILSQNNMAALDKNPFSLLFPRASYYSDNFLSVLNPAKSRNTIRGGTWATAKGELKLANPIPALTNNTPGNLCFHTSVIVGDYLINTHLKLTSKGATDGVGLAFMGTCNSSTENYYYVLLSAQASASGIYKVTGNATLGGTNRIKLANIRIAFLTDTIYNLKVQRLGKTTTVYLNDSLVATISDVSFLTGTTGFCTQNGTGSFLDINVTKATASTLSIKNIITNATLTNRIATISWNTTGEADMLDYEVEKSIDGVNFILFDKVTAKNFASASYLIKDNQLVTGNYYYRVKATSNSGTVTYSNVAKVSVYEPSGATFSLFPNPVVGNTFTLRFANVDAGKYWVTIYSSMGKKVNEQMVSHSGGSVSYLLNLNTSLASGVYTIVIVSDKREQRVSKSILMAIK